MSDSEVEYDGLPDITAGVDLDAIPALCVPEEHGSSEYSFDELDNDALAAVERVEAAALAAANAVTATPDESTPCPPLSPKGPSREPSPKLVPLPPDQTEAKAQPQSDVASTTPLSTPPRKRPRPGPSSPARKRRNVSPREGAVLELERLHSPTRVSPRGALKGGATQERQIVARVLEGFEDELTCPICCDLFACAHVGNPCGHSVCGDCGWDWISKNLAAPTCASCRTALAKDMPMLPNYALDSAVRKHIEALGNSGAEGWGVDEPRYLEWEERRNAWRAGDAKRAKLTSETKKKGSTTITVSQGNSAQNPININDEPGG